MSERYAYNISELNLYIHFTQDDVEKFHDWVENVVNPWMEEKWGHSRPDFIGGKFAWEFRPTSIGTTINVRTTFIDVDDNPELELVGVDVF